MKITVTDRAQFDKWYVRNADQVLYAGCAADQSTPGDIPLYQSGITVFEGGHPVRILVSPADLESKFTPAVFAPHNLNLQGGFKPRDR